MNALVERRLDEFDAGERDFLHNNFRVGPVLDATTSIDLPTFDLHNVEESLMVNHRVFNGNQLTRKEMHEAVDGYRRFLRDHKAAGMPKQFQVPSRAIDRVWHTHMCETEQYARDCQEYFGRMFHHASLLCDGGADNGNW